MMLATQCVAIASLLLGVAGLWHELAMWHGTVASEVMMGGAGLRHSSMQLFQALVGEDPLYWVFVRPSSTSLLWDCL